MPIKELTGVENEDIIDDSLLAVTFSTTEDNQVLSKLGRGMTVAGRRRSPIELLLTRRSRCLYHFALSSDITSLLKMQFVDACHHLVSAYL